MDVSKSTPGRNSAKTSLRRAQLLGRLCTCCTEEELQEIYEVCYTTHDSEVDHKIAYADGGLHCVKNLQVLTVEAHKHKTKRELHHRIGFIVENTLVNDLSDDITSEEGRKSTLAQRLGLADVRANRRGLRVIAPASPYRPIKERARGPRDL